MWRHSTPRIPDIADLYSSTYQLLTRCIRTSIYQRQSNTAGSQPVHCDAGMDAGPRQPREKRSCVTTACQPCRKRKIRVSLLHPPFTICAPAKLCYYVPKCNGLLPTCSACLNSKIVCKYDFDKDRRRLVTIKMALFLTLTTLEQSALCGTGRRPSSAS